MESKSDSVSYKEMDRRLGVDPGTVRRLIERHGAELGISVQRGRSATSNAKSAHYLSGEDADRLASFYEARQTRPDITPTEDFSRRSGAFYVIQLVPEVLPNHIKIGYTDNLEQRLADHQSSAPTARLLASWPCKRSWDYAAMDSISREGCAWVLNEVYEGSPDGFVQRANAFFALMPTPDFERPLSAHSPLRQSAEAGPATPVQADEPST